jgi:ElaB/YqjD/DUF883 family membrane-anchored ribosome-binding protein
MTHEPSPVKYMGTQSPETVHLAAAMAHTVDRTGRGDQVMRRLSRELERGGATVASDSRLADAANWALEKATAALQSAARHLRAQAATAVAQPVRNDPMRAVLIAAGVGAVLMMLVSMTARSGARAVERRIRS